MKENENWDLSGPVSCGKAGLILGSCMDRADRTARGKSEFGLPQYLTVMGRLVQAETLPNPSAN